ncbi:hypothetical protein Scep_023349 [Stephania cephalantha]|uniref:Two-component response regulator n=1 Tax=Stephania cephalantha TaxID=152367 RepID=A0AAP0EV01_9MAGN
MDSLTAIKHLRENKDHDKFDIVITNVHMRNMDGFDLLKIIGLEMDLPVIMLSANEDHQTVMKGIQHGACDYLLKPVRLEEIKNIWQHVVRKNNKINPCSLNTEGGIMNQTSRPQKRPIDEDGSRSHMEEEDHPMQKKTRIVWSSELHHKFVEAFYKIGTEKAVPSKILELMNAPGLTRAQVASHLQKYRKVLEKGESQEANTMTANNIKGEPSNANVLSFKSQRPNELNSCGGIGANNYRSSAMVRNGHGIQNPNTVPNYQMNPVPPLFPFNQLNVALQCPQTLENSFYNCEMAKFPGLGEFPSNSLKMGNLYPQSYGSKLGHESIPQLNKDFSRYTELTSGFPSSHERHFSNDLVLLEGIQHSNGEGFVQSGRIAAAPEDSTSDPLVEENSFYFSGSSIDDLHEVINKVIQ